MVLGLYYCESTERKCVIFKILVSAFSESLGRTLWCKVWLKHNGSLFEESKHGESRSSLRGEEMLLWRACSVHWITDWVMGNTVRIGHLLVKRARGQTAHGASEPKHCCWCCCSPQTELIRPDCSARRMVELKRFLCADVKTTSSPKFHCWRNTCCSCQNFKEGPRLIC